MLFALLIPLVHLNIRVTNFDGIETPISEIGQFRTSYENLISWLDPTYETNKYQSVRTLFFEDYNLPHSNSTQELNTGFPIENSAIQAPVETTNNESYTGIVYLVLLVYFIGVAFFVVRLFMLFVWLFGIIKNNPVSIDKGFKIVQMQGDVPPFSFFRYVFVNINALSHNDLQKILAHEKVHIRQNHSFDLLLAHGISVLQWFNPFAWLLQKSVKTTHEYIADRKVVDQGYQLIDYQSLLLSQLISIRSVELVNNFNLISIKKRIAMMTKNKSGFSSKLKALVIIPFALILFFVFSDMTVKGPGKLLANYYDREFLDEAVQLDGLWKSKQGDSREEYLFFKGNKLSVLEKGARVSEYWYEFKNDHLYLKVSHLDAIPLKYKKTTNELTIWWNGSIATTFTRSNSKNTMEDLLQNMGLNIDLPSITQAHIMERQELCIPVFMDKDQTIINNEKVSYTDLKKAISAEKAKFRALDLPFITVQLFVDSNTPMEKLNHFQQILRQESLLKMAYAGKTDENKISALLAYAAALPQKLPPSDMKTLSDLELQNTEFNLISLDLTNPKSSVNNLKKELTSFIIKSKKYLIVLNFNNNTTFGNYLSYINEIYQTIYDFRNQKAQAVYHLGFDELSDVQQNQIRQEYPITLTQRNLDEKN